MSQGSEVKTLAAGISKAFAEQAFKKMNSANIGTRNFF